MNITKDNENYLTLNFDKSKSMIFNKVIVTTGGFSQKKDLIWLEKLNHKIEDPIPSLFTFNMPNENDIKELMGLVVKDTIVSIQGTKLKSNGPLLITHWGMSGPAILKLSSFGARILHKKNYDFSILVNWVNEQNYDKVILELTEIVKNQPNKLLSNYRPYNLPDRLNLI